MSFVALRSLIRLICEADEDDLDDQTALLRQWLKRFKAAELTDLEKILIDHDFLPVKVARLSSLYGAPRRVNMTSEIGRGSYAVAYEVLYKGKRCVAKVTHSYDDVQAYHKLDAVRRQLPSKNAVNVAEVICIWSLKDRDKLYVKDEPSVIVTEYLVPVPTSLRNELWGANSDDDDFDLPGFYDRRVRERVTRLKAFCDDPERVDEFLKPTFIHAILDHESDFSLFKGLSRDKVAAAFFDHLFSHPDFEVSAVKSTYDPSSTLEGVFDYALRKTCKNCKLYAGPASREFAFLSFSRDICYAVWEVLRKVMFGTIFPDDVDMKLKSSMIARHSDPRVRRLHDTLTLLHEDYDIKWHDLRADNVMMRPSDNELVISDPGLFEFIDYTSV